MSDLIETVAKAICFNGPRTHCDCVDRCKAIAVPGVWDHTRLAVQAREATVAVLRAAEMRCCEANVSAEPIRAMLREVQP